MRSLGFHHLALFTRDVETLAAFYRRTFDLPELGRYHTETGALRSVWVGVRSAGSLADGFFAIEAASGEGQGGGSPQGGLGMVALRVEPAQRAQIAAELEAAGLPIEKQTRWTLYLRDPDGNLVGLSHHPFDG